MNVAHQPAICSSGTLASARICKYVFKSMYMYTDMDVDIDI